MKYIIWPCYLVANLIMLVLAMILAPVLPAFAIGKDHLPRWLSWFDTPDNTLDGDESFKTIHAFQGLQYINRVLWLWRNPSYNFDIKMLGMLISPDEPLYKVGSLPLGGSIANTGWYYVKTTDAWQLYIVWTWWKYTGRIDCGWKLWQEPGLCQFVFSINPFITPST